MRGKQARSVRPETEYARAGDLHIAYHVVGDGPVDLLLVSEFWHSIEAQWEEPSFSAFLRRLASFGRLICFDQRGTGLSDPVALDELPTLEQWMDDLRVVMDAVGSERATLLGFGGGGTMSVLFGATYPDRTSSLVLVNSFARLSEAPDYPWGRPAALEADLMDVMRTGWGRGVLLDRVAPSRVGDETFRQWWARYQRLGSSPGTVLAVRRMLGEIDVRDVLPAIQVPTLVLHRVGNTLNRIEHGRYLAEHIPDARLVELAGSDYFVFLGDADAVVREIERFVGAAPDRADSDRMLATIVFTDIVGSTEHVARLGDRRWTELLAEHHAAVRRELERFRGHEVDTAGDGFLATFDGPGRAVRCAGAIREAVRALGLEIRAGVHTGEVEVLDGKVGGVGVHIAQRVLAHAGPGEVVVTSTVKDLVAGSGLRFADGGVHELKGVPDAWRLFSLVE